MKPNLLFIRIGFILLFLALGAHMYSIQVQQQDAYAQRAQAAASNGTNAIIQRGVIYFTDKNNNTIPAVINKEYPIIYAVPTQIEDAQESAQALSPIVEKDPQTLQAMLSKSHDQYELLVSKATTEQVEKVRALDLKGLYIKNQIFRFYPYGPMASQLLGFISPSEDGSVQGRYGLELEFEDALHNGKTEAQDTYTSIDRTIQAEAESILHDLVSEWKATGGTILVQNPHTGKILAMANDPSFDPNQYGQYSLKSFLNPAVELVYEPGSVFKIVTMSSALDAGVVTPQTTYNDTGSVTLNQSTIRNWDNKAHGIQTMTNVIQHSLNTGSVFAQQQLGREAFVSYVKKFGFGQVGGVELPGEVGGNIKTLENGRDINYATASFGQGISVTPLQMISAVSTIANDGVLVKPSILQDSKTEIVRRVVSSDTAKKMTDILISAVDVNVLASVPQYQVAGKTGTAYVPDFQNGGYDTSKVINTYVGYVPSGGTQFVVLVKLDKPQGAPLAGNTVVPTFKKMTQFLINYYEIAPDRLDK